MPGPFVRRLVASLATAVALAGCSEPAAAPDSPPSSTRSSTATEPAAVDRPTAREIVGDPNSMLREVQVASGDPDARVALWSGCLGPACDVRELAVVLTGDGFLSRTVADATWSNAAVRISADGDVVVLDYRRRLGIDVVDTDGDVTPVAMSPKVAPLAEGEVLGGVSNRRSESVFWATDAVSARAHPVPVPNDAYLLVQTAGGQLRALTVRQTYLWSDDGGATWHENAGAGVAHGPMLAAFAASEDDTHVLVRGSDGATLFPFEQIRRLDSLDSWSVTDVPADPTAYIGPTAVLPDGRFLASVLSWSDDGRLDQPLKGTPPGIYVSEGDDWSAYERIDAGAPFATPERGQPMVVDIEVTDEGALITALGPDQTTAWTSTDLGATWRKMRVR